MHELWNNSNFRAQPEFYQLLASKGLLPIWTTHAQSDQAQFPCSLTINVSFFAIFMYIRLLLPCPTSMLTNVLVRGSRNNISTVSMRNGLSVSFVLSCRLHALIIIKMFVHLKVGLYAISYSITFCLETLYYFLISLIE